MCVRATLTAAVTIGTLSLCLTSPARGQVGVSFSPSGGTEITGSQVGVTVKFCANPEQYYLSHWISFNGTFVEGSFSQAGGSDGNCVFLQFWHGTVTLVEGTNTLAAGFTAYFHDGADVYYETSYADSVVFTGTPPPAPTVVAGGGAVVPSGSSLVPTVFRVTANYAGSHSFSVTTCNGVASNCVVSPSSASLASDQSVDVLVTYSVTGSALATGQVTLQATNSTSGSANHSVRVAPSDPVIAREQCLTIAAGPGARYECGDMRVVHALPSVRTLGRVRAPTLTYLTQVAVPWPIVHAMVTLTGSTRPDSIRATLRVGGLQASRSWPGSQWPSGTTTRRVGVALNADTLATGIYADTLEIGSVTGGAYAQIQVVVGTVIIVNRKNSPFGAGWWLAGFEQLVMLGDGSKLWIGGDGSARRYVSIGGNLFIATPVNRPDTLVYRSASSEYVRLLPGGDSVVFDYSGFHVRTVNRLGYKTLFVADTLGRLAQILIPPDSSGLTYTFAYGVDGRLATVTAPDTTGGSGRVTTFTRDAGRITYIQDPGSSSSERVRFGYTNQTPNRLNSRYDRRGYRTFLLYNGYTSTMSTARLVLGGGDTIQTFFRPASARGLVEWDSAAVHPDSIRTQVDGPRTDSVDVTTFWHDAFGGVQAVRDAYDAITTVTRGDPRWPALPTRVLSPNGRVMRASYDARGNLASATDSNAYDNGQSPTTAYEWHQRWDELTRITMPNGQLTAFGVDSTNGNRLHVEDGGGSVRRTSFLYYSAGNGKGLVRAVVAPGGARDSLTYDTLGNLASTRTPLGWTTRFIQDRLGRTRVTRSPLGPLASDTAYRNDSTLYSAMGRVLRQSTYGPALNGASAMLLRVTNSYDADGHLLSVRRYGSPAIPGDTLTTSWLYDNAGRSIRETAPDGAVDSTWYDFAGNVVGVRTRRGHVLSMSYDRLNRLVRRIVPEVHYDSLSRGLYDFQDILFPLPMFPNNAGGLTLHADTARFAYDATGSLVRADNRDARVRRGYFRNGQLRADTLIVHPVEGTDSLLHRYATAYSYDVNGRLTALRHPSQLASGSGVVDTVSYSYDAVTGALTGVTDLMLNQFTLVYNNRGELIRRQMPGSVYDTIAYDNDARLALDRTNNSNTGGTDRFPQAVVRNAAVQYRDPMRVDSVLNSAGWGDTSVTRYNGLGHAISTSHKRAYLALPYASVNNQTSTETYSTDPLGNSLSRGNSTNISVGWGGTFVGGAWSNSFNPAPVINSFNGAGRLHRVDYGSPTNRIDSLEHNAAGDLEFRYTIAGAQVQWTETRAMYYDAAGRVRAEEYRGADTHPADLFQATEDGKWELTFEEFRYDALGRRVFSRARRRCWVQGSEFYLWPCGLDEVRRTVWAGDQELWEIRMPDTETYRESDTATVNFNRVENMVAGGGRFDPNPWFGRVGYTHGPGLDRPFSITRLGNRHDPYGYSNTTVAPFTVVPHWNWRGQADFGLFADGRYRMCTDSVLGAQARCVRTWWRHRAFGVQQQVGVRADTYWGYTMTWLGSLVEDKENATGTLNRRNRHLDPQTGLFTQEDPIGLAGGLNLYGFASGDPVNFSDPFGLCPEAQRNEQGLCPGGLTVYQWQNIERAANSHITDPAIRDSILNLLDRGRIRAGLGLAGLLRRGAVAIANSLTGTIRVKAEALELYSPGELAFLLAHEYRHTTQPFFMRPSNAERDADRFGCLNSRDRDRYLRGAYPDLGGCSATW